MMASESQVTPGDTASDYRRPARARANGLLPERCHPVSPMPAAGPRGGAMLKILPIDSPEPRGLPFRDSRARHYSFSKGDEQMRPKRTRRARIDPRLVLEEIAGDPTAAPMARVNAARALLKMDPPAGEEDDRVDGLT